MYTTVNYKSKKELKESVAKGERITLWSPGLGTPKDDGIEFIEGPHYPQPHRWYAQVKMANGYIEKVVS